MGLKPLPGFTSALRCCRVGRVTATDECINDHSAPPRESLGPRRTSVLGESAPFPFKVWCLERTQQPCERNNQLDTGCIYDAFQRKRTCLQWVSVSRRTQSTNCGIKRNSKERQVARHGHQTLQQAVPQAMRRALTCCLSIDALVSAQATSKIENE